MSEIVIVVLETLGAIVTIVFAAGGAWALMQRMKKDLNGVGRRVRRMDVNTKLALMAMCPPAERWQLAEFLKEDSNG